MSPPNRYLQFLVARLRQLREEVGMSRTDLEDELILGPGWISRFESGETTTSLDMLLAILHALGKNLSDLFAGLPAPSTKLEIERSIYAEQSGTDLLIHFKYAKYDATYTLPHATLDAFERVIKTLRDA